MPSPSDGASGMPLCRTIGIDRIVARLREPKNMYLPARRPTHELCIRRGVFRQRAPRHRNQLSSHRLCRSNSSPHRPPSPSRVFLPRSPRRPVLHIINGEHYAGAERVQDLLGEQLGNFGYRAGFACLKRGQFAAMRKCTDAPLYDVAMKNRFDLSPVWRLARIIRSEGYRLIHTHTARSAVIGRLASMLTGVALVHHVHSPTDLRHDPPLSQLDQLPGRADRACAGRRP